MAVVPEVFQAGRNANATDNEFSRDLISCSAVLDKFLRSSVVVAVKASQTVLGIASILDITAISFAVPQFVGANPP